MPTFKDLANEYADLWDKAKISPGRENAIRNAADALKSLKSTYDRVEAAIRVPWYVTGLIHNLEASFNIKKHLHNGDLLSARTTSEPAGHPKSGTPPFEWFDSAIDALKLKGLEDVKAWTVERIAYELERYNGFGYRNHHPEVLTPYLWSFTDRYVRGKYIGDHKFSTTAVSDQVGAMALLKQLVANGDVSITRQSGVVEPPPPPPVPVPTGLYLVDGLPFGLRAEARDDATRLVTVETDMAVLKLAEVNADWWQVEVAPPTMAKKQGFAKKVWLKDQTVPSTFDEDVFAQACLSEARTNGISAHFLVALAAAENNGLANVAGAGGSFGPFALTEGDWKAYNDPTKTGYSDNDRFKGVAQASIASRMVAKLTEEIQPDLPDKRLPTSEELYLARIVTVPGLKALLAAGPDDEVRTRLSPPLAAADADRIFALRPALLPAGTKVKDLRAAVKSRLDAGFERAVAIIRRVEPEVVIGPPEASSGGAPWMDKAKEQLQQGVEEIPGGASNPEVEKFFTATTLGRQHDDVSWCAAFISWCVKEAGGTAKHVVYSARAKDWLQNGDSLPGPAYGAVAVTKPYAPTSSGHVGFVVAWDGARVKLLGGNQGKGNGRDGVCEKSFPIADVRGWRMM